MNKFNYISSNHKETMKLGQKISKQVSSGTVIGLIGDLASGKTTFVKGVLRGLGYQYTVSSPTFTLVNNYEAELNVMHVDFYREPNVQRWKEIGFKDLLINSDVVIIEWADLLPTILPEETLYINFEHTENNKRKIFLK